MPSENKMTQVTTDADPSKGSVLGSRSNNITKVFSSSPLYAKPLVSVPGYVQRLSFDPAGLKAWFLSNVVNGVVPSSDNYYGYPGGIGMDFSGSPDMKTVEVGGAGLPATPYVPNPSSPGSPEDGTINVDYTTIPASPEFAAQQNARNPNNYGSDLARTGMNVAAPERNPVNVAKKVNLNSFLLEKGNSETKTQSE